MHASRPWRVVTGLLSAGLVASCFAAVSPAFADDTSLASGENWSVDRAPGGYRVTVELDRPLPMRDDAPSIEADGRSLGIATESADGTELSLVTTDPAVLGADKVISGWASQPPAKPATVSPVDVPAAATETIDDDPASIGSFDWTEATYNFGAQSIPMAGIGGIRGELQGKIYLPDTGGARPVVILLHGRHTSCSGGTANPARWPCNSNQINVPSYKGYDGTGRALASHGYAVVSIAANAINANDAQLTLDNGAQARGQLILDTLTMLDAANKGQNPTYHDAQFDQDVSLTQALGSAKDPADPADADTPDETLTPAQLSGRLDLGTIGLMGHSRGGEGVTSAVTLNQALPHPWAIKAVLPLAPVDFGRMTVPDIPMTVILPYCDGDVSNQQGQHMLDDSRYAFDDDVLRSGVWVMGANHNFFNSRWTPAKYPYSTSDDWSNSTARRTDSICGTDPTVAATSIRLTENEQYDVGTAWMAGFFRMTLGHEDQFLPLFDGSGATPETLGDVDVRSVSTAPASKRNTLTTFESTSSLVRSYGTATAVPCASLAGRTVPAALPACAVTTGSSAVPHWTPASFGGNVPATPVTRMQWTAANDEVRVTVPTGKRDASGFERLSVKMAADESVNIGTDLTLSVKDGSGHVYSSLVSALNPYAVTRMPSSGSTTLKKLVLQQVNVPVSALAAAGVQTGDVREVDFTAATGADALPAGGVYLSDLAFESSASGTAVVRTEPRLNVATSTVDEGDGPGTADVAVYRSGDSSGTVVGYVSILGSATGRGGIAMEKVTFAPGETCKVVTGSLLGDNASSTTASTAVKVAVTNTQGAVMGDHAFANLVVREDDGVTGGATELPPAGVQGNPCTEMAGGASLSISDSTPAPGQTVTLTAAGYRAGEGVSFAVAGTAAGISVADGSGVATLAYPVAADAEYGPIALTSAGAGTGFTAHADATVKAETTTALALAPVAPRIKQPATLTATIGGPENAGTVEFFDGETSLGIAPTVAGVATLDRPGGFLAGSHELTARFAATDTAQGSSSAPVTVTLTKDGPTIALGLSAQRSVFGSPVTGAVVVGGAGSGEVTLSYGAAATTVPLTGGAGSFRLPAALAPGAYTVTVSFAGNDELEPGSASSPVLTVTRKATTSSVSGTASVKRGRSLALTARVGGGVAGTPPGGSVRILVRVGAGPWRTLATRTLPASGALTVRMKAPTKAGVLRIRTVYSGSATYLGSSSSVKKVVVRK
jgi:hypothetical protein